MVRFAEIKMAVWGPQNAQLILLQTLTSSHSKQGKKMEDIGTIALTLFLVMDPLGNVPAFLAVLRPIDPKLHQRIVWRELAIALAILTCFTLLGGSILTAFGLRQESIMVSGGVVLLLISIKMIFPTKDGLVGEIPGGDPLIVPLAVPLTAGPSALATLLLFSHNQFYQWYQIILGLILAWLAAALILVNAPRIHRVIGARGAAAMERLMGLVLVIVAIQMLIDGILVIKASH